MSADLEAALIDPRESSRDRSPRRARSRWRRSRGESLIDSAEGAPVSQKTQSKAELTFRPKAPNRYQTTKSEYQPALKKPGSGQRRRFNITIPGPGAVAGVGQARSRKSGQAREQARQQARDQDCAGLSAQKSPDRPVRTHKPAAARGSASLSRVAEAPAKKKRDGKPDDKMEKCIAQTRLHWSEAAGSSPSASCGSPSPARSGA